MHELAASKMSQTAAIAENSYKIREWIWSRYLSVWFLLVGSQPLSRS